MRNFNNLIEQEYKSAYESAYDLSLKKEFSTPKIYTANNDLSKRWYVYFSYRSPDTGKLKRQTPIYGEANKYKTKEERLAVLTILRQVLQKLLRQGYNPYQDNEALYRHYQVKENPKKGHDNQKEKVDSIEQEKNVITNSSESKKTPQEDLGPTLKEAFDFDLILKEKTLQPSSLRSYGSHIKIFKKWLNQQRKEVTHIRQVNKSMVSAFLLEIMTKTSARNRNNYRASLSSFFSTLEEYEMVRENFIKKIKNLKTTTTRNKTYTKIQQLEIFDHLENEDPTLLLFIKFVSYNFLRPIEVCRLKIGDINAENRTLSFKAKNSPLKTKIIPEVLWEDLPDLDKHKPESFLFTPDGIGGVWETTADNKRNYFSKRFKRVVKDKFGLGEEYGLYSFRHTYITKLYRELRKTLTPFETKSYLMQITGHSTMLALEQYLRDIDAELPEDYSKFIETR
ncbi:tyrosine-type recombinase/integrase [Hanstruepera marina]|uniref:tyrosine-type recombinase/integrase n=1 Tax=Hanstruepera marina TaxID=2873265 RepID=UPI001CA72D10|nr:site-specific integrase [Hanstruepera marina]